MAIRWRHACTLSLLLSGALQGAEYTESVPADLLRPALDSGTRLYRDLPADFPLPPLPEGYSVIAVADRGPAERKVLLRSPLEGESAVSELVQHLGASGWEPPPPLAPDLGIRPGPPPGEVLLCHADGTLFLSGLPGAGGTEHRVSLRLRQLPEGADPFCDDLPGGSPLDQAWTAHLPELQAGEPLPPERLIALGAMPVIGIRSGDRISNYLGSELADADAMDLDSLYAGQLRQQGWQQDVEWEASGSAGSNWSLRTPEDEHLFLELLVEEVEEDVFVTTIEMRRLP